MFRVASVVVIASILAACASDAPTKQGVRIVEKRRTCTVTNAPITKAEFCATQKACPTISTCGEAYYRYATCGEDLRDGGVAGERNGIPCQKLCGMTALEMAQRVRSELPFSPPMRSITVCDPA